MYDYLTESANTNIVGSFTHDKNKEFKDTVKAVFEGFNDDYQMNLWDDCTKILKNEVLKESYKGQLLGDVLEESFNDSWYDMHKDKLEQLFENTALEIVTESQMGMMNPIVGFSLPILKKNYYENISKDIVMTEVPDKPIVRVAWERGFLKDAEGNKYYIPECFYDNSYKKVYGQTVGVDIYEYFNRDGSASSSTGRRPIPITSLEDYSIVKEVSPHKQDAIKRRESLAADFCIAELDIAIPEVDVTDEAGTTTKETVTYTVKGLNIQPDFSALAQGSFMYKLNTTIPAVEANDASSIKGHDAIQVKDTIFGQVDTYYGTLTLTSAKDLVTGVIPGGHLSNENNERTVELDYERQAEEWKIQDGPKLNSGLTLEKIKDTKALLDIDITSKIISDMTTVLTNFEDNGILDFLDGSYTRWKDKTDLPFGFGSHIANGKFVEESKFSCVPQMGLQVTQSNYIESELKFNLDRLLDQLKTKLNNKDVMFVVYAHPNNITLLNSAVRWVVDEDTKIGGCQLDYRFGILTNSKTRVHVLSSQKVPQKNGFRIVAYPLTKEVITFKHFKYSFNIENSYNNPLTPLTPNIMATQRVKTVELLPVQGNFELTNNGFGLVDRDAYAGTATSGDIAYPR